MASTDAVETVGRAAVPGTTAARPSLLAPLRVRNFRLLWIGQSLSMVGDQFKFVALSWLVLSLTGRSGALGSVLMLQAIPRSILMIFGGVASDRIRPRTVMLGSDILRALVVATFGVLVATNLITMPYVYALALIFGLVHAFFIPATMSITPELVPPEMLRQANAVQQITMQVVMAMAPAAAGFVIARAGTAAGFGVDAVSFIVSAAFLTALALAPRDRTAARPSALRDFVAGLAYLKEHRLLRYMIIMASVFFFGHAGSTYVGLPVFAKGPLAAGPGGLGILFSASGIGALLGGAVGGMVQMKRRGVIGSVLIIAMGCVIAAVALTRNLWAAAALLFFSGAAMSWVGITYMTIIQQSTDRAFMGRVMGLMMFGIYGMYPFSYGLAGWLSEAVGVRLLFVLGGALIILAGTMGLFVREIRGLE
jgi:MFS family permease